MGQAIPVLKIEDEDLARSFYVDGLGFKVDWDWRQEPDLPIYMGLSRDGWVIHLTEHAEDCDPGGAVYFIADNGVVHALVTTNIANRAIACVDPDADGKGSLN